MAAPGVRQGADEREARDDAGTAPLAGPPLAERPKRAEAGRSRAEPVPARRRRVRSSASLLAKVVDWRGHAHPPVLRLRAPASARRGETGRGARERARPARARARRVGWKVKSRVSAPIRASGPRARRGPLRAVRARVHGCCGLPRPSRRCSRLWLALLIVTAGLLALAGLLASAGLGWLLRGGPHRCPKQAIEEAKLDGRGALGRGQWPRLTTGARPRRSRGDRRRA